MTTEFGWHLVADFGGGSWMLEEDSQPGGGGAEKGRRQSFARDVASKSH